MSGKWSPAQQAWHINKKELHVVLQVLQKWGQNLQNQTVQFLMDNITAVSHVSKQGGQGLSR